MSNVLIISNDPTSIYSIHPRKTITQRQFYNNYYIFQEYRKLVSDERNKDNVCGVHKFTHFMYRMTSSHTK